MKKTTYGARCAIQMHSITGDIAALCYDLRNGVKHYFGDHTKCNSDVESAGDHLVAKVSQYNLSVDLTYLIQDIALDNKT